MALNLNITELRSFGANRSAKLSDSVDSTKARALLLDIRSQLVGRDGTIQSGYLRIHNNKQVEGETHDVLTTQGRYSGEQTDKMAAKRFVTDLISEAYGETLTEEQASTLNTNLEAYFAASGSRFGTQSFVKLINALETRTGGESLGNVKANARLATPDLGAIPPSIAFQKSLPAAECGSPAAAQFAELKGHLSPDAQDFFKHLFNPLQPGSVSEAGPIGATKSSYVLGDADGSICRTALAAMNCGMMQLDSEGLKTLAEVMEAETNVIMSENGKREFQADAVIREKIDNLVTHATYSKGESQLVSIGDILHDRFSNNKQAMATLIEKLHDQGAVFITGNHDVYDEVNPNGDLQEDADSFDFTGEEDPAAARTDFEDIKEQNGFYGAKQLTKEASDDLVAKCFVNAHFDKTNAILYTHNGVVLSPNSVSGSGFEGLETYSTGLGEITPDKAGAVSLAEKMNKTPYNRDASNFTNFRPKDGMMQTQLLGLIAKWEGRDVRFVHGHDANHGVTGNVINVNARNGGFSPILMVIE